MEIILDNMEQPKNNNSLIILLSILLFISCIIAGFFSWKVQTLSREITNYRLLQQQKAQIPTSVPMSDWKTYINNQIGFIFNYPSSFNVVQEGWQKIGSDTKGNWILNLHRENPKFDFFVDYRENPTTAGGVKITEIEQTVQGIEYTKFSFLGYPAVKYSSSNIGGMLSSSVNILKDGNLWTVYEMNWESTASESFLDQILSTFKFLN